MRIYLIFLFLFLFLSCKDQHRRVEDNAEIEYNEIVDTIDNNNDFDNINLEPNRQADIDSLSISDKKLFYLKSIGNNHFSFDIDLPNYDLSEIDKNIMTWINNNLEEESLYSFSSNSSQDTIDNKEILQQQISKRYTGDVLDYKSLALFYVNKHFDIYNGPQLGIDCSVKCKKIYESKDVISYEVNLYLCDYSVMQSKSVVKGATFFKYDGSLMSWGMFEDTNVKDVLKTEVNRQFFKFPTDKYEEFILSSRFKSFTLPLNPPYMTRDGLKFVYMNKEFSEKEGDDQIKCIISIDKLNINPTLSSMLK